MLFPIRWRYCGIILRNTIYREVEYRGYYWLMIISLFSSFASDYLLLTYAHSERRHSFVALNEILSFVLLGLAIRSATTLWGQAFAVEREIRTGEFRRYLLQPVKFSQLFTFTAIGEKLITWLLLVATYSFLLAVRGSASVVVPHWSFSLFFVIAIAITWCLYYSFVLATFWLHEATFMIIAFNICAGIFSGSVLPFDWLPETLRRVLMWTPLPFLGYFPIRAALGKLATPEIEHALIVGSGWVIFLAVFNTVLFQRGVRRYESYGG